MGFNAPGLSVNYLSPVRKVDVKEIWNIKVVRRKEVQHTRTYVEHAGNPPAAL